MKQGRLVYSSRLLPSFQFRWAKTRLFHVIQQVRGKEGKKRGTLCKGKKENKNNYIRECIKLSWI
jgi:hypothetical protein